jgi:CHAD domain-containing protein
MAARLKTNEAMSQGVLRIAKKQAAVITKHLQRKRIYLKPEAVHHIRKHIKKLRALLRLVHKELGRKTYRREKAGLRQLNRALSPVREATVHLKTLDSLRRSYPDDLSKSDFNSLKQALLRIKTRRMRALKSSKVLGHPKIRRIKSRMGDWELGKVNARGLWSGIEQARQRFRDAQQRAALEPNDENIHEWRKRAKDLLYQSEFLKNIKPDFFNRRISRLKKLGDCLGAVHDLARLESDARKLGVSDGWLKFSGTRRLRLQKLAFALADQNELFADKFQS